MQKMNNDFCVFILTHGRAEKVLTYDLLRRCGYTGKIYIVIDDEDSQESLYREKYGDQVIQFSKEKISKTFDEGDNFTDRRTIVYARNACWELAKHVNCRFFIEMDDDYRSFAYRHTHKMEYVWRGLTNGGNLDKIFLHFKNLLADTPISSISFSQGGDHIGGGNSDSAYKIKRKSMNSFFCDTQKEFKWIGRINEDVNTYCFLGHCGALFFNHPSVCLVQSNTQQSDGGMTGLYLKYGTYIKSFISVLYCPSFVKISMLNNRIHHSVNWNNAVPKIIKESVRKP